MNQKPASIDVCIRCVQNPDGAENQAEQTVPQAEVQTEAPQTEAAGEAWQEQLSRKEQQLNQLQAEMEARQEQLNRQQAEIKAQWEQRRQQLEQQANLEQQAYNHARELVERCLLTHQQQYRQELNRDSEGILQQMMTMGHSEEQMHRQMVEATGRLQADFAGRMNSMCDEMNNMRNELYDHLGRWQREVFHTELEPLARCYADLYRLVNMDRLIRNEILFQDSRQEASPDTVRGLQTLEGRLGRLLQQLMGAMKKFEMYPFIPEPGEAYDSIWHESGSGCDGDTIRSCEKPGVYRKMADGKGDVVLLKAEVYVEGEN